MLISFKTSSSHNLLGNIPSESRMAQGPTVPWSCLSSQQDEMTIAQYFNYSYLCRKPTMGKMYQKTVFGRQKIIKKKIKMFLWKQINQKRLVKNRYTEAFGTRLSGQCFCDQNYCFLSSFANGQDVNQRRVQQLQTHE